MGANSSSNTNHVVIEQEKENVFNVVYVSDDAVRRLRGIRSKLEEEKQSPQKTTSTRSTEDERAVFRQREEDAEKLKRELFRKNQEEAHLRERLSVLEAKLASAGSQERKGKQDESAEFYQLKLDEFLKHQAQRQDEATSKFKQDLDSFHKRHMRADRTGFCHDIETQVLKCYEQNADHPLKCDKMAKNYYECVKFHNIQQQQQQQHLPISVAQKKGA